jgi:hypothetical protein
LSINPKDVRATGSFRVRGDTILLYRVGPANAQRQNHNRRPMDMVTGKPREWDAACGDYADYVRRTPERRGIWAFPFPFHDAFFYHHVWRRQLPKRMREGAVDWRALSPDEAEARCAATERKLRDIRNSNPRKLIWHAGPFWSHVRPVGQVGDRTWWRYENPRDFVEAARGGLWSWYPDSRGGVFKTSYSKDHLEIFVPG